MITTLIGSMPDNLTTSETIQLQNGLSIFTIPDDKLINYKDCYFPAVKYQAFVNYMKPFELEDLQKLGEVVYYQMDCPDFNIEDQGEVKYFAEYLHLLGIKSILHCCGNLDIEMASKTGVDYLSIDIVNNPKLLDIYQDIIYNNNMKIIAGVIDGLNIDKTYNIPHRVKDNIVGIAPCCGLKCFDKELIKTIIEKLKRFAITIESN